MSMFTAHLKSCKMLFNIPNLYVLYINIICGLQIFLWYVICIVKVFARVDPSRGDVHRVPAALLTPGPRQPLGPQVRDKSLFDQFLFQGHEPQLKHYDNLSTVNFKSFLDVYFNLTFMTKIKLIF